MRLPRLLALVATLCAGSAWAAPVMDLPGEALAAQGAALRARLNLSASQAGAWLQAESRTRAMLQERRARRERLQMEMETTLANEHGSLADLAGRIDADESQALEENRLLRQTWLRIFEGLDGAQRRTAAEALHAQLEAPSAQPTAAPKPADDGRREGRGGKGSRGGALGGSPMRF